MRTGTIRPLLLPTLLAALVALLAAPTGPARAEQAAEADVMAWDVSADFRGADLLVTLTTYSAIYAEPAILSSQTTEITRRCIKQGPGTILFQGGYATFDGSAYYRCELPPSLLSAFGSDNCEAVVAQGYFFFSADVTLQPITHGNPLLTASDGSFAFSAPGDGVQSRTRVRLSNYQYDADPWLRDAGGNMLLMGQYGPLMIEANKTAGLLSFLPADWQPFFQNVDNDEVGHWMSASAGAQTWGAGAVELPYREPPRYVFIGRNPATGATFRGDLAYVEGDPPGCTVK